MAANTTHDPDFTKPFVSVGIEPISLVNEVDLDIKYVRVHRNHVVANVASAMRPVAEIV